MTKYYIFTNSAGCLPDGEPEEFSSYEEAQVRLHELFSEMSEDDSPEWMSDTSFSHSSLYSTYIEEA